MKNFYIVARSNSITHETNIKLVKEYLESKGAKCTVDSCYLPDNVDSIINVPDNTDCVITVGGDGTVVRIAHSIVPDNIPIIGLNCGHLGYLCDMNPDNIEHCLDMLLTDSHKLENRMMLEGGISGIDNETYTALNDVVVRSTDAGSSVITLTVKVNGIKLYSHDCDGLIMSTPTGSTAYNLSANGPIVSPHAGCIILTSINPHTLNSRSIILAVNDEVDINIEGRRDEDLESAYVIFDGIKRLTLNKGQILKVKRSSKTTRMVMLENVNFLERIRVRMQEI